MLGTDIEVGKAYVYMAYRWSDGQKFLVTGVEKTQVRQRNSYYKTREATFYVGWLYPEGKGKRWEARVEARELHGDWEPFAAQKAENERAQAEHEAKQAAERVERKPKVLALERLLKEAGIKPDHYSYYYGEPNVMGRDRTAVFNVHEVGNDGKDVEIDLDDLIALVEHLKPGALLLG